MTSTSMKAVLVWSIGVFFEYLRLVEGRLYTRQSKFFNKGTKSVQDKKPLTEGVFCRGSRPLPRWWRVDSGCGSGESDRRQQLNRHHRAELHAERRRCTPPSPERCRHTWSRWGPGAAGWSGPDAWPGGHFRSREKHTAWRYLLFNLYMDIFVLRQFLSTATSKKTQLFNHYLQLTQLINFTEKKWNKTNLIKTECFNCVKQIFIFK